ncbi:hypothetical protein BS78_05G096900 [Paspalum vaginatum]|nr:hypothetical protein BS78_05G096900 [Paspalum vaginatum]
MAEAVVGVLISKLGAVLAKEAATYGASLLYKEASALKGLYGEIRKAEGELEMMKAYLHDSEKFKDTNETTSIFVKKIRDLAFRIEDVVDEFMYELEASKHGGFASKMKKKIKHVKIWRRLALELRDINAEVENTAKRRDHYAIPGMVRYSEGSNHHKRYTNQLCFARDEDLVGIKVNAEKLTQWLIGNLEERNHKIATVWGMGGSGKTTLVDYVYKIVKGKFDISAWVTVSKTYNVMDLLKTIAREFGTSVDDRNMEMRNLVEVIHNHLEGKSYILILDDVWEQELWINIIDVFPTNCVGRFILTSRKYEVASLATSGCIIEMEPLSENHSRELFCNVAFRNNDNKRCPAELYDLAEKFLQKCEGLPIAIACIGRLLSCKTPSYFAWKSVYEELESQSAKNVIPGADIIIKVSLEDLPYELRNCFLHCAIYPEDYKMKRRSIIKHWVAAGFIKEKEQKTLEEVAESYLNEIVNRSLLQVVKKNEFGRLKCCRMHDVVRRIALNKAKKEFFGNVYEGSNTFSIDGTRRLSILSNNVVSLSQSGASCLRAIHAFASDVNIDLLRTIIVSAKLLSTLDLQGTRIKTLPNEIFSLFNLRLLGLRNTGVEVLPEAVGKLRNLEVLDAIGTGLLTLPKEVAKLKKLISLYACTRVISVNKAHLVGIDMPRGIRNMTGLHALYSIKASLETLCDVAALTELRTFGVCHVTSEHSLNLCSAVRNMSRLVHLSIIAANENEVLPFEALCLPASLSKLEIEGQLEKQDVPKILSSWSHLNNLTRLCLAFFKLDEDSFPSLMVLRGLCILQLGKAYDGKKLHFSAFSFPRLRTLAICGAPQLNEVKIEKGALESLVDLVFSDCPELNRLPHGIEYLASLEELYLLETAVELIEKLRLERKASECNEEFMKISHIKKIVVRFNEKNIWEKIS